MWSDIAAAYRIRGVPKSKSWVFCCNFKTCLEKQHTDWTNLYTLWGEGWGGGGDLGHHFLISYSCFGDPPGFYARWKRENRHVLVSFLGLRCCVSPRLLFKVCSPPSVLGWVGWFPQTPFGPANGGILFLKVPFEFSFWHPHLGPSGAPPSRYPDHGDPPGFKKKACYIIPNA